MELTEAIRLRRSVRKYKSDRIPEQVIKELVELAAWAPSGSNGQPWIFVVVENREYLQNLSDRAKTFLLERIKAAPALERYQGVLSNPQFNIFYDAPTLVLICGDTNAHTFRNDCSMAAQNLMLSAWERGVGSCWIGFATGIGNAPDVKRELKIPEEYELVAPIVLGYPDGPTEKGVRKEARVMTWRK